MMDDCFRNSFRRHLSNILYYITDRKYYYYYLDMTIEYGLSVSDVVRYHELVIDREIYIDQFLGLLSHQHVFFYKNEEKKYDCL